MLNISTGFVTKICNFDYIEIACYNSKFQIILNKSMLKADLNCPKKKDRLQMETEEFLVKLSIFL